ncbi:glucokinase [Synechococcus sp. HB1133]|uniref:glucokinase n=1 Tax=unclassified Synechococcus TaxID=2626047 RepID=UPI0014082851|nr:MULTISPECIES: glucokinase [unclassified Synechococcus]MCB4395125.1 glucokinase [Synechococcus sp. PH41509]MCB4422025.1 glucokinase [Synechococcus sp. HB1133]MCB4430027.1 glucokinase [Synechococcus sp. HBA1120]NHI80968.1 glucokinase [Synechococcus sp. HB1133]
MATPTLLAGDMGGTKTLLALYESDASQLRLLHQQRFRSGEWSSLEPMLASFLNDRPADLAAPEHACIAVAGPVRHREARITNLPWRLREADLAHAAGLERLELVNDFGVLIYGLPHFDDSQQVILQNGEQDHGPLAILGAGTGLGMARGLQTEQGLVALASEGGHREFAPRNEAEWDLACWLKKDLGVSRLSIERIVSGTGLGHVAHWLLQKPDAGMHPLRSIAEAWRRNSPNDLPAQVSLAAEEGDPLMQRALQLWLEAYGSAAGDLALQELCTGGLWVGGGTAAKQLKGLRSANFLNPMRDKGRFSELIEGLQVTAVIDPDAGLFSAACRAQMLAESGGTLA